MTINRKEWRRNRFPPLFVATQALWNATGTSLKWEMQLLRATLDTMDYFQCNTCQTSIKLQFGSNREPISHLYGCSDCAHGYRIAQVSEGRRRRQAKVWAATQPRDCKRCGVSFTPEKGDRGVGVNTKNCLKCRSEDRECLTEGCTSNVPTNRQRCKPCQDERKREQRQRTSEQKERDAARRAEARARKAAERVKPCVRCGDEFDTRRLYLRKDPDTILCVSCNKKAASLARNRIRDFKDRMFTAIAYDDQSAATLLAILDEPCTYCGSTEAITIEHRMPLIRGGTNELSNLAAACKSCNSRKQDLTEEEYRAKLETV
jgi:hypothetical protein